MIVLFSKNEIESMVFCPVARPDLPTAYLEERERVWQVELAKSQARGDTMWNGEIYTIEEIRPGKSRLEFRVSTCEFKDIILRWVKGTQAVQDDYGSGRVFRNTGVTFLPRTADGAFLFGIRGDHAMGGTHPVGMIGGNLNKDEQVVRDYADLRAFAMKEINEETALEVAEDSLRFVGLGYANNLYLFTFTARLPYRAAEVENLARPGEFSRLTALTREQALAFDRPMTPAFRFWRENLDLVGRMTD